MKKIIAVFALLALIIPASFVMARDANQDALWHTLRQQQRQQKRWEAVKHSTGAARQQALTIYQENLRSLWEPAP